MDLPEGARLHATRVVRLGEGDVLRVFDAGQEFEAKILTIGKHHVAIEVGAMVSPPPERPVPLHLIMSPLKGDLTELVIQKATELGVARISPVVFERTDTVARRDPTQARLERWHRVATSAAEQSGRAVVPLVDTVAALADAVSALGEAPEDELRVVAAEPSLAPYAGASATPSGVRSVVVAVGPAGGLSPGDLRLLNAAGFSPERFALHTLRSETACLAAVSILGARFG
jgi:16S rRNA (uracil1498-N3)-methyltransferase